jgi:hypothetical protein
VVKRRLGSGQRWLYRSARSGWPRGPRRVMVQARQIYCFAKAAQIGWYPQGHAIALKGLEYLLAKAKRPARLCSYPGARWLRPGSAARHLRPRFRAALLVETLEDVSHGMPNIFNADQLFRILWRLVPGGRCRHCCNRTFVHKIRHRLKRLIARKAESMIGNARGDCSISYSRVC